MKELKEEAKRHHEAKLHKYGASHEERKACGGSMKRAHGGKVHEDEKEDEALIKKEVKSECLKHRADGGPIAGGMGGSKLGRGRKGGKKGTNVNVVIAGKGDGPSAPMMPPPALGSGPSAMPPKPMLPPAGPPAGLPPRPGMAGPMAKGGKVHKKEHKHKESSHNAEHHRHHRKQHH